MLQKRQLAHVTQPIVKKYGDGSPTMREKLQHALTTENLFLVT